MRLAARAAGALTLALSLAGCAAAPWACTSDSCVSVASADLPADLAGIWHGQAGDTIRIVHFRTGDEGTVVKPAALLVWDPPRFESGPTNVRSFDGRVSIAEQRIGEEARAPRCFHRLDIEGDRLTLRPLDPQAALALGSPDELRLTPTEFGTGIEYGDVRSMAAILVELLADDSAWGAPEPYLRAPGSPRG